MASTTISAMQMSVRRPMRLIYVMSLPGKSLPWFDTLCGASPYIENLNDGVVLKRPFCGFHEVKAIWLRGRTGIRSQLLDAIGLRLRRHADDL
jgi:hypothetical protein